MHSTAVPSSYDIPEVRLKRLEKGAALSIFLTRWRSFRFFLGGDVSSSLLRHVNMEEELERYEINVTRLLELKHETARLVDEIFVVTDHVLDTSTSGLRAAARLLRPIPQLGEPLEQGEEESDPWLRAMSTTLRQCNV
jgi:hypothetical protein